MKYLPDPFMFRRGHAVVRTLAAFANARQTGIGVDAARSAMERARHDFDAYKLAASQLTEAERVYAIAHGMPAPALLRRRATLSAACYRAAVSAGKPLPADAGAAAVRDHVLVRGIDVGLVFQIV